MLVAFDSDGNAVGQVTTVRPFNPDAVTHPERYVVLVNRFSQYVEVRRASVRLEEVRD